MRSATLPARSSQSSLSSTRLAPSLIVRLATACLLIFGFCGTTWATTFHLVLAADSNDETVGKSVHTDLTIFESVFKEEVNDANLRVHRLTGYRTTEAQMLSTIRGLRVGSNDIVVFFFSGHGAFDDQINEHVMQSDNGLVKRSTVRSALQAKGARLTVLITNTCSNFREFDWGPSAASVRTSMSLLFRTLFLNQTGLVDISCTSPGEFGKTAKDGSGSVFVKNFAYVLYKHRNERMSWARVIHAVNNMSKAYGQTAYPVSPIGSSGYSGGGGDAPAVGRITGRLNSAKMTHNVTQNRRRGAWIDLNFEVTGARGKKGYAIVYFNCLDCGTRVPASRRSSFRDKKGDVWQWSEFNPSYESTSYKDFRLFIPYGELNSHSRLSYDVHIHVMDGGEEKHIAGKNGIKFTLSR